MDGGKASHRNEGSSEAKASNRRRPQGVTPWAALAAAVIIALLAAPMALQLSPTARPPINDLLRDLQTKYDSVADFSANFEHSYAGGLLSTSVTEHGSVLIKKPGKMRWSYDTSDEKLYVSNGTTFYSYFPIDRQVIVTSLPPDDYASTPALFLAGRGNIRTDFVASYEDSATEVHTWTLRLTPHNTTVEYEWLVIVIDRTTLSIVGLSTKDYQGGRSTYRFSQLEENKGISDDLFDFRIPPDTDVIRNDPVAR